MGRVGPARRHRTRPRAQAVGYDLLSSLGRRWREQRITVTPRLTPEARAAGLRIGDPVPLTLTDRWTKIQSGLIVPAQVGRPVTVTLPRSDYALLAYGSPADRLFRAPDPYVAIANARVARERRSAIDVPLYPRASQRARASRALLTPRARRQPSCLASIAGRRVVGICSSSTCSTARSGRGPSRAYLLSWHRRRHARGQL